MRQEVAYNFSLAEWHRFVASQNSEVLAELLDENITFHSPFVWKPKEGKAIAIGILISATETFQDFRYIREIIDGDNWALEFEARVGELTLRGVDLIKTNEAGKIIDFEVMIRPANALQKLAEEMGKRLAQKGLI